MRRGSAEPLLDGFQLVDDDLHQQRLAGEDAAQVLDHLQQLRQLVEDLLPLEAGQPLELHLEDGLRLELREAEGRHQPVARFAWSPCSRESALITSSR